MLTTPFPPRNIINSTHQMSDKTEGETVSYRLPCTPPSPNGDGFRRNNTSGRHCTLPISSTTAHTQLLCFNPPPFLRTSFVPPRPLLSLHSCLDHNMSVLHVPCSSQTQKQTPTATALHVALVNVVNKPAFRFMTPKDSTVMSSLCNPEVQIPRIRQ